MEGDRQELTGYQNQGFFGNRAARANSAEMLPVAIDMDTAERVIGRYNAHVSPQQLAESYSREDLRIAWAVVHNGTIRVNKLLEKLIELTKSIIMHEPEDAKLELKYSEVKITDMMALVGGGKWAGPIYLALEVGNLFRDYTKYNLEMTKLITRSNNNMETFRILQQIIHAQVEAQNGALQSLNTAISRYAEIQIRAIDADNQRHENRHRENMAKVAAGQERVRLGFGFAATCILVLAFMVAKGYGMEFSQFDAPRNGKF